MATKNLKVCDVTGRTDNVQSYHLQLGLSSADDDDDTAAIVEIDLCPSGLTRLVKLIHRGCTPPDVIAAESKAMKNSNEKFDPANTVLGGLFK